MAHHAPPVRQAGLYEEAAGRPKSRRVGLAAKRRANFLPDLTAHEARAAAETLFNDCIKQGNTQKEDFGTPYIRRHHQLDIWF